MAAVVGRVWARPWQGPLQARKKQRETSETFLATVILNQPQKALSSRLRLHEFTLRVQSGKVIRLLLLKNLKKKREISGVCDFQL